MVSSRGIPNCLYSCKHFQYNEGEVWLSGMTYIVQLELDPGSGYQLMYKFRQVLYCPKP